MSTQNWEKNVIGTEVSLLCLLLREENIDDLMQMRGVRSVVGVVRLVRVAESLSERLEMKVVEPLFIIDWLIN